MYVCRFSCSFVVVVVVIIVVNFIVIYVQQQQQQIKSRHFVKMYKYSFTRTELTIFNVVNKIERELRSDQTNCHQKKHWKQICDNNMQTKTTTKKDFCM